MKPIIEVRDLCKTYTVNKNHNNVLRNVSLNIEEGEMVAIMGPSGSGKSTLLYAISGMDSITAGEVRFNGSELNKMSGSEIADLRLKEMGFVFQQMYMLSKLNILDNITLPALQLAKTAQERKEAVQRGKALMHSLNISDIATHQISEVSGGQLQRACIARAVINRPKVLFADEPTGALNRANSDEVMAQLGRINREGTTIVLVSHDVKVSAGCSRVMYLVDGNIVGEINLGPCTDASQLRLRERQLNNWLMEMGW